MPRSHLVETRLRRQGLITATVLLDRHLGRKAAVPSVRTILRHLRRPDPEANPSLTDIRPATEWRPQ